MLESTLRLQDDPRSSDHASRILVPLSLSALAGGGDRL